MIFLFLFIRDKDLYIIIIHALLNQLSYRTPWMRALDINLLFFGVYKKKKNNMPYLLFY